jgi:hypothetical protein
MADPGFGRVDVDLSLSICGELPDQLTCLFIFLLSADTNTSLCIESGF